jgi:uncharacterized protein (TIGR02594 family)
MILGVLTALAMPARADDSSEYAEYPFQDYFNRFLKGRDPSLDRDIDTANELAASMPTDDHFNIMQRLSQITQIGSTGEVFNTRWKKVANPLIVRFFHDIGYKQTPYPGDCTPWCAATVSWCLRRAGRPIPRDPASSQSFLHFGRRVNSPKSGDLCVFTDIGRPSNGHIGLYVSSNPDSLMILGGNQTGDSITNCGPGYRKSKITVTEIPINPSKDRAVGIHYLSAIVRPS